ncbi:MAG: class I SAM-dependent methyltransferase [Planctomycetaceae bacterium]
METSTPCDLCQQNDFATVADRDRHGRPLLTAICRHCGLVRHATVPTESELQQFYSTIYREEYNGERTPGPRRVMRAWNNGERICGQVAPLLPRNARVLEVGAGIGCTVKVFERAGFRAEGIDPGGEFLKFSRDQLHTNVRICNLYDLQPQHQYDAVLLVHVIEHLRSPSTAVKQIAGLLKPGGMLYVECPNLQAPFARRSQLFHAAHIFNFVPETLQCLAQACGFRLRKRFGDQQDVNLQMLFQHTGECRLDIDSRVCGETVEGLNRANPVPYHLRWRYLTERFQKVAGYAREHLSSKTFVSDLIEECGCGPEDHEHQPPSSRAA